MNEKFKVIFLEDAATFIDNLDESIRNKIIYNVTKAKYSNDKELFKKLNAEIWEFRTLLRRHIIDYSLFGTKLVRQRQ